MSQSDIKQIKDLQLLYYMEEEKLDKAGINSVIFAILFALVIGVPVWLVCKYSFGIDILDRYAEYFILSIICVGLIIFITQYLQCRKNMKIYEMWAERDYEVKLQRRPKLY